VDVWADCNDGKVSVVDFAALMLTPPRLSAERCGAWSPQVRALLLACCILCAQLPVSGSRERPLWAGHLAARLAVGRCAAAAAAPVHRRYESLIDTQSAELSFVCFVGLSGLLQLILALAEAVNSTVIRPIARVLSFILYRPFINWSALLDPV
jgi:hypothetical protein